MIDDVLRALEEQLGPAESEPVPLGGGPLADLPTWLEDARAA